MKPSAKQYRDLMTGAFNAIPDGDPTKEERRLMMSCLITCAETCESLEKTVVQLARTLKKMIEAEAAAEAAPAAETDLLTPPGATPIVTTSEPIPTGPSAAVTMQSSPNAPSNVSYKIDGPARPPGNNPGMSVTATPNGAKS